MAKKRPTAAPASPHLPNGLLRSTDKADDVVNESRDFGGLSIAFSGVCHASAVDEALCSAFEAVAVLAAGAMVN